MRKREGQSTRARKLNACPLFCVHAPPTKPRRRRRKGLHPLARARACKCLFILVAYLNPPSARNRHRARKALRSIVYACVHASVFGRCSFLFFIPRCFFSLPRAEFSCRRCCCSVAELFLAKRLNLYPFRSRKIRSPLSILRGLEIYKHQKSLRLTGR